MVASCNEHDKSAMNHIFDDLNENLPFPSLDIGPPKLLDNFSRPITCNQESQAYLGILFFSLIVNILFTSLAVGDRRYSAPYILMIVEQNLERLSREVL
jgi:hypothetical protein